ncbi:MAG TPA: sensor histidine kinase [Acidobacteriota bacterium]|nr:sensor histidine kinase [Acidobacteriota bacterium]
MQSRFRLFQRLQWQLTLAYVSVTVVVVLVVEILGWLLLGLAFFLSFLWPQALAAESVKLTPQALVCFEHQPPDREQLKIWVTNLRAGLQNPQFRRDNGFGFSVGAAQEVVLAVTDPEGTALASAPDLAQPVNLMDGIQPDERAVWEYARQGFADPEHLNVRHPGGKVVVLAPIIDRNNQVHGLLYVRIVAPFHFREFAFNLIQMTLYQNLVILLGALVIGSVCGYLVGRRFSHRFQRFFIAAQAWSQGEFQTTIPDASTDEVGELAERLNLMAQDLNQVVQLRERVTLLEERARLARELHDTVKQQLFATTMQLGAATALMTRNPDAAASRIREAEKLTRQAQSELKNLIEELRTESHQPLDERLRQYATDWSRQSSIPCVFQVQGVFQLMPETQIDLVRIVQEALANIQRHSQARKVILKLIGSESGLVQLNIVDDGVGFDPQHIRSQGMGLKNMQHRAKNLPAGTWQLISTPGGGTEIVIQCKASI